MPVEKRENLLPSITLKEAVINATFKPGRVYKGPDIIDLEPWQQYTEELIDYTLAHPKRHEAGRIFYVQQDNKTVMGSKIIEGEEDNVYLEPNVKINMGFAISRRFTQDKFVAVDVHSHPRDQVFSTLDMSPILAGDRIYFASTSSLVITPNRKILMFRGENTPQYDPVELKAYIDSMRNIFKGTGKHEISKLKNVFKDIDKITAMAAGITFGAIAMANDLQVFEGKVRDRYLHRVANDKIRE